jgi:hypothetical protein
MSQCCGQSERKASDSNIGTQLLHTQ